MLKDFQNGLGKFFTREKVVLFLALLLLSWVIDSYSDSKHMVYDNMYSSNNGYVATNGNNSPSSIIANAPLPVPAQMNIASTPPVTASSNYALQPVTNPSDLLPQDSNSQWSALNPVTMNQGNINMPDLLQAGYHIGLDTIGQTLRNANQQLRSDPIIPVQKIGPWNQSTIEPDYGRTPLEIGVCS
jgi:hypothetical protein